MLHKVFEGVKTWRMNNQSNGIKMTAEQGQEVSACFNTLAELFPNERTDIWSTRKDGHLTFTAMIGDAGMLQSFGYGKTPSAAIKDAAEAHQKVASRIPSRIAELESQIAQLRAMSTQPEQKELA